VLARLFQFPLNSLAIHFLIEFPLQSREGSFCGLTHLEQCWKLSIGSSLDLVLAHFGVEM